MNNQEPLSALAEVGQMIHERWCEARREEARHRALGNTIYACMDARVAAVLVELGNAIDRKRIEAQKANGEKPSTAVRSSAWVGGCADAPRGEGVGGRCEYRYGYHPEPVQCERPAYWIMTDDDGKETRYCMDHREVMEGEGDWRRADEGKPPTVESSDAMEGGK